MTSAKTSATLSRRDMLLLTVAAAGAVVVAEGALSPAEASSQVSKSSVSYQPTPKGKAKCADCVQWRAPSSCAVVAGNISPNGWCIIFAPKS